MGYREWHQILQGLLQYKDPFPRSQQCMTSFVPLANTYKVRKLGRVKNFPKRSQKLMFPMSHVLLLLQSKTIGFAWWAWTLLGCCPSVGALETSLRKHPALQILTPATLNPHPHILSCIPPCQLTLNPKSLNPKSLNHVTSSGLGSRRPGQAGNTGVVGWDSYTLC